MMVIMIPRFGCKAMDFNELSSSLYWKWSPSMMPQLMQHNQELLLFYLKSRNYTFTRICCENLKQFLRLWQQRTDGGLFVLHIQCIPCPAYGLPRSALPKAASRACHCSRASGTSVGLPLLSTAGRMAEGWR